MIVCAYTDLQDKTRDALNQFFPDVFYWDVSKDEYSYWRILNTCWNRGEDLFVVEHDIIVNERVQEMQGCLTSDWCTFAYESHDKKSLWYWALGCARFSANLQSSMPEFIPETKWDTLDKVLVDTLVTFLEGLPHCHGVVEHIHSMDTINWTTITKSQLEALRARKDALY